MQERPYILLMKHIATSWFRELGYDGFHMIVPSELPSRFQVLCNTKTKLTLSNPKTDKLSLQRTYPDYDIFYLNILSEDFDLESSDMPPNPNNYYQEYPTIADFDLSDTPSNVVAFVCVPKNDADYVKDPADRLAFVKFTLDHLFNRYQSWWLIITDQTDKTHKILDSHSVAFQGAFDSDTENWFNMIMNKYGITQSEITEAKSIIQLNKTPAKSICRISPDSDTSKPTQPYI